MSGDNFKADGDGDELRHRRGTFLEVVESGGGYLETSVKGEVIKFVAANYPIEVTIEDLTLHTTSDVSSGVVRPMLTGRTFEKFRAIGAEGSNAIIDVVDSSNAPSGTAVNKKTYANDGHALRSEMSLGLPDETINEFVEKLPGKLRIGGIKLDHFDAVGSHNPGFQLDHWRRHSVPDCGSEDVTCEWLFTFSTATVSPKAYSRFFGNSDYDDKNERHLSGHIGVHFENFGSFSDSLDTIQALATNVTSITKNIFNVLAVIGAVLVYLAFRAS